jgi:hypothetical protein
VGLEGYALTVATALYLVVSALIALTVVLFRGFKQLQDAAAPKDLVQLLLKYREPAMGEAVKALWDFRRAATARILRRLTNSTENPTEF